MGSWGWLLAYEVFVVFGVVMAWGAWELIKVERLRRRDREDEGAGKTKPDRPPDA